MFIVHKRNMMHLFLAILFSCGLGVVFPANVSTAAIDEARLYNLRKCSGPGCPYTASWLAHVNLYRNLGWKTDSTKMETHSFVIFDGARQKYQLEDHNAYYVHHMSMFEHFIHKESGFDVAQKKTSVLADAAYKGECGPLSPASFSRRGYLGLIPFYSGLPPNVTGDLHVRSIGQGNSLVKEDVKLDWLMATSCSVLKYFGEVVVGVTSEKDRELVLKRINQLGPWGRRYMGVVQFRPKLPSHLPNQMLHWGQTYIKEHNCGIPENMRTSHRSKFRLGFFNENKGKPLYPYAICDQTVFKSYGKDKFHVDNFLPATFHQSSSAPPSNASDAAQHAHNEQESTEVQETPYHMVYFTESDQIVVFEDEVALQALTVASNSTTFFVGRRKHKNHRSDPADYMGSLDSWRQCGTPGFSFEWPHDVVVHQQRDRRRKRT